MHEASHWWRSEATKQTDGQLHLDLDLSSVGGIGRRGIEERQTNVFAPLIAPDWGLRALVKLICCGAGSTAGVGNQARAVMCFRDRREETLVKSTHSASGDSAPALAFRDVPAVDVDCGAYLGGLQPREEENHDY